MTGLPTVDELLRSVGEGFDDDASYADPPESPDFVEDAEGDMPGEQDEPVEAFDADYGGQSRSDSSTSPAGSRPSAG